MKTKIVGRNDGVQVQISDVGSHADELLLAFKACQAGKCSCPTREYEKVESVDIAQSGQEISLSVRPKAGQQIDVTEIEKCLEHTTNGID